MKNNKILSLIEGAVMVALAMILSLITIIKMPFGGGITAASMAPIIIVSYRRKVKWGILVSFVYSVLQLVLGMENLQYGTSFSAVCCILLFDYIIAFLVIGLSGLFRNSMNSQGAELACGALLSCILRFVCHFISGCTVWAGVSIPTSDSIIYSLVYNAAYMIPESIITIAAVWYLASVIDFRADKICVRGMQKSKKKAIIQNIGLLSLISGVVFTAIYVFRCIQNEDGFDITGILNINPYLMFGVLGVTVLLWAASLIITRKIKGKV